MALSFTKTVVASTLIGLSSMLGPLAQEAERGPAEALDVALSPECRVPAGRLYTLAPLKSVRAIQAEKRPLKVLSLGSAGATTGFGSGSTRATYSVQLEGELQKVLPAISIDVEQRELPGEITAQAVERISGIVAETEPDLVVWQVGISDALAKADLVAFTGALNEVLEWLSSHEIDVVLIEPPYSATLAEDEHYKGLLTAIQKSARDNRVPLVLRFEAMEFLGQNTRTGAPTSPFRLSHLGAWCIAEHVARTVAVSVLQPDNSSDARR